MRGIPFLTHCRGGQCAARVFAAVLLMLVLAGCSSTPPASSKAIQLEMPPVEYSK